MSGAVVRRTFRLLNPKQTLSPALLASNRNAHFQFVPTTPDPSLGELNLNLNLEEFN